MRRHFGIFAFYSLLLTSCATYTDHSAEMNAALSAGNFDLALQKLDTSPTAKSKTDLALYKMERGTLFYLKENYELAAQEWASSLRRIEELYTTSISKQAASMTINDSYADYEGEWHERILLPIFSALAYMANDTPKKAIVEIRKTNEVLNQVEELSKGKSKLSDIVFARFVSGYIYEAIDNFDGAMIEYKKGIEAWNKQKDWQPRQQIEPLAEALGRIAEFRRRNDLLQFVKSQFPNLSWKKMEDHKKYTDTLVVFESGKSPMKVPQDFPIPAGSGIVNISFATYKNQFSFSNSASVWNAGKNLGNTEILLDVNALANQGLSERRAKDIVRLAARIILKDQTAKAVGRSLGPLAELATSIAGAVSERADTRGWISLPETVQIKRVLLAPSETISLQVKPVGTNAKTFQFSGKSGECKLVRLRTTM